MQQWLEEKRQPARAIERFWRQVLVSAINEELDRMAAAHGFQVFRLGFLARKNSYEMGVPAVPLGASLRPGSVEAHRPGRLADVQRSHWSKRSSSKMDWCSTLSLLASSFARDHYICALPFERIGAVLPDLPLDLTRFEHLRLSPASICGSDRPVTSLPCLTRRSA